MPDPRFPYGARGYACNLCDHRFPRPLLTRLFGLKPACPNCGSTSLQPFIRKGCIIFPVNGDEE
jgi:DNA-directed RNA polymerase subunit RPC12/RpoP